MNAVKVKTSYFYKVRFFTPNVIPLSTAMFDPKWYHANKGTDYCFLDKNGVINGLRCELFMPGPTCNNLCRGSDGCQSSPTDCAFLKEYRKQLDKLNFDKVMEALQSVADEVQATLKFTEEPTMALIVHEAPSKPCSERVVIQQWFAANGYPISEW